VFALLRPLGAELALGLWELGLAVCLVLVLRGWSLPFVGLGLAYLAIPVVPLQALAQPLGEVLTGNVQWLLVACILGGFRWPALWAIPILTKVSPIVGLVWFVVRRDGSALVRVGAAVLAVVLVSVVLSPGTWLDWLAFVEANWAVPSPVPVLEIRLVVRLPIALILLAWGGLADRRWTVFIGVALASPVPYLGWLATLAVAAVVIWLRDRRAVGEPLP
jgi:hypothetical protein